MGNPETGRQILEELLEVDENDEEVWLWLSAVVDTDEDREICLENVLALNPANKAAQQGMNSLKAGAFNPHLILDELLDLEGGELPEITFLDEFVLTDDDDVLPQDDEIKLPSTMAGAKTKQGKPKKGCNLNLRLVLVAVLALVIVVVLVGLAAMNMFFGNSVRTASTGAPADTMTRTARGGRSDSSNSAGE